MTGVGLVDFIDINLVPIIGGRHIVAIVSTIPTGFGSMILYQLTSPTVEDGDLGIRINIGKRR